MPDPLHPRLALLDPLHARLQHLAYPLVRAVTGAFLMPHGAQKLFGFADGSVTETAAVFARFGLHPALPLAYLVGCTEFFGGLCILLGAFTRTAALAASLLLAVATFLVALPQGWFWAGRGMEYPMMWTLLCLAVLLRGGGPLSIDALRGRDA